jgi:hypothetical protein
MHTIETLQLAKMSGNRRSCGAHSAQFADVLQRKPSPLSVSLTTIARNVASSDIQRSITTIDQHNNAALRDA